MRNFDPFVLLNNSLGLFQHNISQHVSVEEMQKIEEAMDEFLDLLLVLMLFPCALFVGILYWSFKVALLYILVNCVLFLFKKI